MVARRTREIVHKVISKRVLFLFVTKFCAETTLEMRNGQQIESFTGSVGWCVNFVRRHGMKSIALHGRLEQWFDVENNDDVREKSISDIADDIEQLAIATPARDIEGN